METKRNTKYFTAPPFSIISIIGWVIVIAGLAMLSARYLRMYGIIAAIAGFALVVLSSGGKSTDTDLEYQISEKIKNLQELSEKKFEVYERSFLKQLKPINLRGYDFLNKTEPFYYRKGQDNIHRTNYFVGVNLIFTSEKVFIYGTRFSLTDEAVSEEIATSYYFTELDRAEVVEQYYTYTKGDREMNVRYYVFTIYKNDGTAALQMCVDYGADIDKYAEQISRAIVTRQKELAKRAEETAARKAAFRAKVEAEKAAAAAEANA